MLLKNKSCYLGLDIGSDTIHCALLDNDGEVMYMPSSIMHFGNPVEAIIEMYENVISFIPPEYIKAVSFTGSLGRMIAETTSNPFYFDTIAISSGADLIAPDCEYLIHVGSKDPYFFEREKTGDKAEEFFVSDHGTGTKCGGGSGILINKQVRRFFADYTPVKLESAGTGPDIAEIADKKDRRKTAAENRKKLQAQVEKMHILAAEAVISSGKNLNVGGRCGVIIQSDMIHMQNSGEQIQDILKGMYKRIAANYRSDVIRMRTLDSGKKTAATGGIFLNSFLADVFAEELGLEIFLPENCEKIGAAGAALLALKEGKISSLDIEKLETAKEAEVKKVKFAPPLSSALHLVHIHEDGKPLFTTEGGLTVFKKPDAGRGVVIGVDGGSTTTKALIADSADMEILAEICIDTDGRPLEAAQKVFREIKNVFEDKLVIKGITYTGSSGQFYHRLFTDFTRNGGEISGYETDIVKDEITCHAEGVRFFNKDVDTIFECGGQDAKFTVFNPDGTVKKAKMNLSCMAGTGQSMKNMLDMLGLDFKTFRDYALAAKRTPVSDEMCAIFTEADILKLVALGFPIEEVAAATAYGFMGGYSNKFVGNEKFGSLASAQGGPFKGLECLAALALHTGAEIHAFPHRQLFGAMGAALVAFNRVNSILKGGESPVCRFRGFGVADIGFEKLNADCSAVIPDSCGTRDCRLQIYKIGDEMVFSGGLCPKGNTQGSSKRSPDYISLYKNELDKELSKYSSTARKTDQDETAGGPSAVYIPRSLHFLNERGVFFASLYHYLGFKVFVSPESDEYIASLGIAHSHSESCYPSKLHYGHTAYLKECMRHGTDKILLVNYLGSGEEKAPQNQSKTCPYVSGAGFAAKDALKIDSSDVLLPVLVFNDDIYKLEDDIIIDLKRAFAGTEYAKSLTGRKVATAVKKALKTQEDFNARMHRMGSEIVEKLKKKNEKIFLGIGRGYTIFDNMASSKIHELFIMNGLHFIPCFFLKQPDYDFTDIVRHMYWFQGREMTRYNLLAALDPNLYGVRETNFNCGPDAMLSYHEGRIFDITGKPYLTLQTDGHNSNAQFGTRAMANFEVVKNHIPQKITLKDLETEYRETDDLKKRILGIPDMGTESSEMLVAVFKSAGYRAEAMPSKTQESEAWARKYLITNNCLPMHILFGDVFAWVHSKQREGLDPNNDLAVFVPMAGGPCRLGQYHIIVKQFLDECGFDRVSIVNPAAYLDWENLPVSRKERSIIRRNLAKAAIASDILMNAQLSIRPYETVKGSSDAFFADIRKEFLKIVGEGCDYKKLTSFMKTASEKCLEIDADISRRYPLVSLFGEIFVRSHTGANENSITKLESFRLEIVPRLLADMFEYVNKMQRAAYWKEKRYLLWFGALVKGFYMMKVEKGLSLPFRGILAHRRFRRPIDLYNELRRENIFDVRIKGEAGISIGITHDFINSNSEGLSGVYQLEPFGCMQECVASSKIQSLIDIKKTREKNPAKRVIPYLTGVFGDSQLSNLEAEMAMFAEKCYIRQRLETADRGY